MAFTATAADNDTIVITERITASGRNIISQPEALTRLLTPVSNADNPETQSVADKADSPAGTRRGGYRIQVFLDNNPRTAKATARSRAAAIASRFPELRTYITYNSPYWRLRCGDFTTQADAARAAEDIRAAFPASAKEVRVVRDRINR